MDDVRKNMCDRHRPPKYSAQKAYISGGLARRRCREFEAEFGERLRPLVQLGLALLGVEVVGGLLELVDEDEAERALGADGRVRGEVEVLEEQEVLGHALVRVLVEGEVVAGEHAPNLLPFAACAGGRLLSVQPAFFGV